MDIEKGSGARWEEQAFMALLAAGYPTTVDAAGVADYQGWGVRLHKHEWNGKHAVLAWGYGSCSGCDPYEDEPPKEIAKQFIDLIQEFDDEASARLAFDAGKGW